MNEKLAIEEARQRLWELAALVRDIQGTNGSREMALVMTKLDEARLWLQERKENLDA